MVQRQDRETPSGRTRISVQETTPARPAGARHWAGLAATAAIGLALLTGMVLGRDRLVAQPAAPPAALIPAAVADPYVPDQFTYREDHRVIAPLIDFGPVECGIAPCISAPDLTPAISAIDFGPLECGMAPCVSAPAHGFVPDQFTYREDHRVPGTTPPGYRESHGIDTER